MSATTQVAFVEAEKDAHYSVAVTRIPPGEFRTSSVTAPGALSRGSADLDSNDLGLVNKPGGQQVGAAHEAGHMLGLDDEYGTGKASHSDMVEDEFGRAVTRGPSDRIMSGGMAILPEHGVTFLNALKEATGTEEWSTKAVALRPVPDDPRLIGVGDFPSPPKNDAASFPV